MMSVRAVPPETRPAMSVLDQHLRNGIQDAADRTAHDLKIDVPGVRLATLDTIEYGHHFSSSTGDVCPFLSLRSADCSTVKWRMRTFRCRLAPMSPFKNYWSRKAIIGGLCWLREKVGHVPSVKEVRAYSKTHPTKVPSYSTITREFESAGGKGSAWEKALAACGFDTTYSKRGRRPKDYTP